MDERVRCPFCDTETRRRRFPRHLAATHPRDRLRETFAYSTRWAALLPTLALSLLTAQTGLLVSQRPRSGVVPDAVATAIGTRPESVPAASQPTTSQTPTPHSPPTATAPPRARSNPPGDSSRASVATRTSGIIRSARTSTRSVAPAGWPPRPATTARPTGRPPTHPPRTPNPPTPDRRFL